MAARRAIRDDYFAHTYSEDRHHQEGVPLPRLPSGPFEPRGRGAAEEVAHVV